MKLVENSLEWEGKRKNWKRYEDEEKSCNIEKERIRTRMQWNSLFKYERKSKNQKEKDWNIYNLNEKEKYMKREREGQETIKALE